MSSLDWFPEILIYVMLAVGPWKTPYSRSAVLSMSSPHCWSKFIILIFMLWTPAPRLNNTSACNWSFLMCKRRRAAVCQHQREGWKWRSTSSEKKGKMTLLLLLLLSSQDFMWHTHTLFNSLDTTFILVHKDRRKKHLGAVKLPCHLKRSHYWDKSPHSLP